MSFVLYIVYVRNVSRDIWHVFNKILFSFRARLCVASPILVLAALPGLVLFELFKRSTLCLPCQIHILLSLLLVLLLVAVVLFYKLTQSISQKMQMKTGFMRHAVISDGFKQSKSESRMHGQDTLFLCPDSLVSLLSNCQQGKCCNH